MVEDVVPATLTLVAVTAALPAFLKGAGVVLNAERVTWDVLTRHLKFILTGLALTTVPILVWMLPRFGARLGARRVLFLHAFLGAQAYAMLLFGGTGIYRVFRAKYEADLYDDDTEVRLEDLHENVGAWRGRIRIGVFGYVVFWLLAYVAGVVRYYLIYWGG
jgi:hypothetical protein